MGRTNMMGFRPVDHIPMAYRQNGRGLYDGLITDVHRSGVLYGQDTKDEKRAKSLASTLRASIKRLGYDDVFVVQRYTAIYLERRSNDHHND